MLSNNIVALGLYIVINIVVYTLDILAEQIFDFRVTSKVIIFEIPILLLMIFMFIYAGKRFLESMGSKINDLFSVSLIAILGILIAIVVFLNPTVGADPRTLFWAYIAPCISIVVNLKIDYYLNLNIIDYSVLSIFPSILMWLGIQWKKRNTTK